MADATSGAVTFLFTDIEGSTALLKRLRERYGEALAAHRGVLEQAIVAHRGRVVDTQGDSFFVAFGRARDAVEAAVEAQRGLAEREWPDGAHLRVRMGIDTGEATVEDGHYVGLAVHRAARICSAAHGGQVLVSRTTHNLLEDEEADLAGIELVDLGEQRLKDLDRPIRLYQANAPGADSTFPPPRTGKPLPTAAEAAVGPRYPRRRIVAIAAVATVAVASGVVAAVLALSGGGARVATRAAFPANAVGVFDPQTLALKRSIAVGVAPSQIVAGGRAIWVANTGDPSVSHIDPARGTVVKNIAVDLGGSEGAGLAASRDAAWVSRIEAERDGRPMVDVTRIDAYDNPTPWRRFPAGDNFNAALEADLREKLLQVPSAASGVALWIANHRKVPQPVFRVPIRRRAAPQTLIEQQTSFPRYAVALAVGEKAVWIANANSARAGRVAGVVERIDSRTNVYQPESVPLPASPLDLDVGLSRVWVAAGDAVLKVDPQTLQVEKKIPVPTPTDLAVGAGYVWSVSSPGRSLSRIDPNSGDVDTLELNHQPEGVAAAFGRVWVTAY